MTAAAGVVCPLLPVVFDRACSFNNRGSDKSAFVLRCDAPSDSAVARLRQALRVALGGVGLDPKPSRTPHMTMRYDQRAISEHPIEPICWIARRFALILSHVGLEYHQWIGCWNLSDGTQSQSWSHRRIDRSDARTIDCECAPDLLTLHPQAPSRARSRRSAVP